jgi:hypothetical protein
MADSDEKGSRGFTVIDRRASQRAESDEPAPAPGVAEAATGAARPAGASLPGMDFSTFIVSLATSALCHMGLVDDPETGKPSAPNLDLARQTIDILAILEDKTRGNLAAEEARLLETLLYDLRMNFVQVRR